MDEVKLLTGLQKARLKQLAETLPCGEYEWVVTGPLTDEEAGMAGGVPAEVRALVPDPEGFADYVEVADCGPTSADAKRAEYIVAAQPRVVRALLAEIEHLEAVNASLRRDLAAARDEGAALALSVMRDEGDARQA